MINLVVRPRTAGGGSFVLPLIYISYTGIQISMIHNIHNIRDRNPSYNAPVVLVSCFSLCLVTYGHIRRVSCLKTFDLQFFLDNEPLIAQIRTILQIPLF